MTAVAIIPAKGTSKRLPRKNVRAFMGKPMLVHSIETARASALFERIVVSTDDDEIAYVASRAGAQVHVRTPALCADHYGTQDVARIVLAGLDKKPEYACCIYATAPLMLADDLERGLARVAAAPTGTFAFSAGLNPLRDAAQFYWGSVKSFMRTRAILSEHSVFVAVPDERVCDINDERDWQRAEALYAALQRKAA